jgi:hypothetical protein
MPFTGTPALFPSFEFPLRNQPPVPVLLSGSYANFRDFTAAARQSKYK